MYFLLMSFLLIYARLAALFFSSPIQAINQSLASALASTLPRSLSALLLTN